MQYRLVIAVILFGVALSLWGEPVAASELLDEPLTVYLEEYWNDTQHILTAPARWESRDWLGAGLVIGTTLVLYESDEEIQRHFQKHRNSTTADLANVAENLGDVGTVLPVLALVYGYGKYTDNQELRKASLLSIESVVISCGFTVGLKLLTHRSRPYTGEGHDHWGGLGGSLSDKELSFPSAHSAAAFSMAAVLATVYKEQAWVPYVAYSLATLTALSRIHDDVHWASDVFLGSVIGWYTAKQIITHGEQPENSRPELMPVLVPGGAGLMFHYKF